MSCRSLAYTAFLKKALEVPVEEMPKPDVSPLLDRVRAMACKDYMLVKKVLKLGRSHRPTHCPTEPHCVRVVHARLS